MTGASDAARRGNYESAPATTASLGPETGRFGKRVLHLPVDGLEAVAKAVVRATKKVGKPPEPRSFKGHVTLARARDRRRGVDLRPLVGTPVGRFVEVLV